ncbi:CBS domain protein [Gregarina niphandrodes]|uniref:CBS domain protein n=1 Tax=Gregarina niphandrodes TaxID=110365 RepID=A0A023B9K8_GRENI|nr:CBS domain protein [Gregarina niphandrodes]EZG72885.1 CBS domain protein [Gregarina niphandrodes]|eukprot:XP_011129744.1 CBS domain protein [Gregarina niphandrodes]
MDTLIWDPIVVACLVLVAGLISGLTVGILGLDHIELKLREQEGDLKISRVIHMLKRKHLILVSLLIVNTVCQETLPLLLNEMMPEWASVVFSVTCVLLFGEIIPQAVCSGSYRMSIVRFCTPLVRVISWIVFPLAYPIAKLLDWMLGAHTEKYYGRNDLKAVIRIHQKPSSVDLNKLNEGGGTESMDRRGDEGLLSDEVIIIEGALDMAKKTVETIMVKIADVYALEEKARLTMELRKSIVEAGHSRIPVYREQISNIVGMVYIKNLITVSDSTSPPVGQLIDLDRFPIFIRPDHNLYDLMNTLQTGKHIALVTDNPEAQLRAWEAEQKRVRAHIDVPNANAPTTVNDATRDSDTRRDNDATRANDVPGGAENQSAASASEYIQDGNIASEGVEFGEIAEQVHHAKYPVSHNILGLVTIEDVLEELIQEEIYDEFDKPVPALMAMKKSIRASNDVSAGGILDQLEQGLEKNAAVQISTTEKPGPRAGSGKTKISVIKVSPTRR